MYQGNSESEEEKAARRARIWGRPTEAAKQVVPQQQEQEVKSSSFVLNLKEPEPREFGANIQVTCSNDCIYCYSAVHAVDKGYVSCRAKWANDFLKKQVPSFKNYYDSVVHYPTNHDITQKHLERHCQAIREILEAGNTLVITTKPRLSCMAAVAEVCAGYENEVTFNLTITTLDEDQSVFWERWAPLPAERIAALKFLHEKGFKIKVTAEPLLQGVDSALQIYAAVIPYAEEVCFGVMNKVESRVDNSTPENVAAIAKIQRYQSKENMKFLHATLKSLPKVSFKESISKFASR